MKYLTSKEIRKKWLDFFQKKEHLILESKSLIPVNDPSLLWINSGVATLKDYFSGKKMPPAPRLTNSQKCIRTNDIENVGITSRHHTFFEMLGNFSIGNYFKSEAIEFAYGFVFNELEMPKELIFITYHGDDLKTYEKWLSLGIEPSHLIKGNNDTNFWDVGQGPCGPCTEIFFDRGNKYDTQNIGIKLLSEDIENDRYIEIWNVVFSEFNNDGNGNYEELKQKNIDTGAGLERIASIFQNAPTNFDTDAFLPIIHEIENLTSTKYDVNAYFSSDSLVKESAKHFRVIADHMRAVTVAIQDGAIPSNVSRGYIIRRLIRRAYRSGIKLGIKQRTFLSNLVDIVATVLDVYPIDVDKVKKIILKEEEAFSKTIDQGQSLLREEMKKSSLLTSEIVFKLFETYGFPVELTEEIAAEHNVKLDMSNFQSLREKHAEVSRAKTFTGMESQLKIIQEITGQKSTFVGYDILSVDSKIIFQGFENGHYYVLVHQTPFYATSGGQSCDEGTINGVEVLDVFKDKYGNHWHVVKEKIEDDNATLEVDQETRINAERNHTATHLLGKAIFEVLGESRQRGSENSDQKLRYDFPALTRPTEEIINEIEQKVKSYISADYKREYILTTKEKALEFGAIALEGEEYSDDVRVVDLVISKEFCGGTHIAHLGLIEDFKIIRVDSKGTGIFRIEAITSFKKVREFNESEKAKYLDVLHSLIEKNKALDPKYLMHISTEISEIKKQIEQAKEDNKTLNKSASNFDFNQIELYETKIGDIPVLMNLYLPNPSILKSAAANLRELHKDKAIVLGSFDNDKHSIAVASVKYDSNSLLKKIFENTNGRGGGQPVLAMGSAPTEIKVS